MLPLLFMQDRKQVYSLTLTLTLTLTLAPTLTLTLTLTLTPTLTRTLTPTLTLTLTLTLPRWVQEMWGYSIAAASLGIKHKLVSDFQVEPL